MAIPSSITLDFDTLVASTMKLYLSNNFADNIFNRLALFAFLNSSGSKKMVDGGEQLVEPLEYGENSTVQSFMGLDTIDTQPQDGHTAALYNWKAIAGSASWSETDALKNNGRSKIIDFIQAKVKNLEKTMRHSFNQQAFSNGTGNNSKDLTGLQAMVSATGIFANINRATYTWWRAIHESTVENMSDLTRWRKLYNDISDGSEYPNLIICDQPIYEWYEALCQAKIAMPAGNTTNKMADLGFQALAYKGVPVVFDRDAPTGNVFMLNSDYINLRVHSNADFKLSQPRMPTNQFSQIMLMMWFGNLTTNNCRRLGRLSGKTPV